MANDYSIHTSKMGEMAKTKNKNKPIFFCPKFIPAKKNFIPPTSEEIAAAVAAWPGIPTRLPDEIETKRSKVGPKEPGPYMDPFREFY